MSIDKIERELRDAIEDATPGPWRLEMDGRDYVIHSASSSYMMTDTTYYPSALEFPDARYVVAANPENIRALLDELSRLREVERMAKEVLHPFYMADKRLGWSHLNAHVSDDDDIPVKAGDMRRASDLFRALSEREGQDG